MPPPVLTHVDPYFPRAMSDDGTIDTRSPRGVMGNPDSLGVEHADWHPEDALHSHLQALVVRQ